MSIRMNKNSFCVFSSKYFPALLFLSSLLLCLLCPLNIISPFLSVYPPLIILCIYHPPLSLPLGSLLSSFLAFLSFPSSCSVLPLSSTPSFFFLCSIPHIPVGFLRGRTPLADRDQTLLQCSRPLPLFLSSYLWSSFPPLLVISFHSCSLILCFLHFFSFIFLISLL